MSLDDGLEELREFFRALASSVSSSAKRAPQGGVLRSQFCHQRQQFGSGKVLISVGVHVT
jgi:hypothetical protein